MQDKKWQVADTFDYAILKQYSKENRLNQTKAEILFWSFAKGSGLGEKCRRQYIIGQYIVDFFFRNSMLIVELDGEYHLSEEQKKEDIVRQEWLEQNGYNVLRFRNDEVMFEIEKVVNTVKLNIKSQPLGIISL